MVDIALFPVVGLHVDHAVRQQKQFRRKISPMEELTDEELRARYRFGKDSLQFIESLVKTKLERCSKRNQAITPMVQLLVFLRFVASGSFFEVIGDTFGLHKSTVSRIIQDVGSALVSVKDRFIVWPQSERRKQEIRRGFFDLGGFPQVIGCVDGTHIRIQSPTVDEAAYVNRKNFHSINVQGICDHQGKFTNVVARWPGCTHDSHIFTSSMLCDYLEQNHHGLDDGLLLGDSGYPCKPYLMTPFLAPVLPAEKRFNRAHKSSRCTIERTFGQWKRRFHVLHSEVRLRPQRVCGLIVACAVLHNIAKERGEPMGPDIDDTEHPVTPFAGTQNGAGSKPYCAYLFRLIRLSRSVRHTC